MFGVDVNQRRKSILRGFGLVEKAIEQPKEQEESAQEEKEEDKQEE